MKVFLLVIGMALGSVAMAGDWSDVTVGYGPTKNLAYNDARRNANWECDGVLRNIRVTYTELESSYKATMLFDCHTVNR